MKNSAFAIVAAVLIISSFIAVSLDKVDYGAARARSGAAYVRANDCKKYGDRWPDSLIYDDETGNPRTVYGWQEYSCANGVMVIIQNNEEQP